MWGPGTSCWRASGSGPAYGWGPPRSASRPTSYPLPGVSPQSRVAAAVGCRAVEEVRECVLPFPLDVRLTLGVQGRGTGDPTFRVDEAGAIWRTSLTPHGPATLRVTAAATVIV